MADTSIDDPRPKAPVFTQKPPVQSDYTTTTTNSKGYSRPIFNSAAFKEAQNAFLDAQKTHQSDLAYYRDRELPEWTARQGVKSAGQVTKNKESERQQKAQAEYQESPDAKTMTAYKTWAMPAGTLAGGIEGHVFGRGMTGAETSLGLPEGRTAFQGTAAKRATMMAPSALIAGLGLAKAADLYHDANDSNATPYDRDYAKAGMNFMIGQSAGALGAGAIHSLKDIGGPNSLSGGNLPKGTVPPPPPYVPLPSPEPVLDLKGKTPTEASREILTKIGVTPGASLKENKGLILKRIPKADPAIQNAIAASHDTFEPGQGLGKSIAKRLANPRRLAIPLAAVGAGTAAMGLGSGESEAGGLPAGGPAKDESMTQYRLRQVGLGSPAEAVDTASYYAPGIGLARAAWDVGSTAGDIARRVIKRPEKSVMPPDSRFAGLEKAQAGDARQRAEMAPEREPVGEAASRATPKDGGVTSYRDVAKGPATPGVHPDAFVPASEMGFDPTHLPEYERGLLEKGMHPSEAAMHLMPHARAGAEAVRRGEDFWGGTDQYERERAALRGFYGAVNSAQGSSGDTDTGISDDVMRALGGRVGARR
jgi:hypothetical protein